MASGINAGALGRVIMPASNIFGSNTALTRVGDPFRLFSKKPVTLAPVLAMPDQDAVAAAKAKSANAQYGRQGRASTILTGDADTLG